MLRMASSNSNDDDTATFVVWGFIVFIGFLVIAWPYLFGTWLAVRLGADNPSTARTATGWILEALWLGGFALLAGRIWLAAERNKEEERQRELAEQQQARDFGPEGLRLFKEAETAVSSIAATEAARDGWLGKSVDFDFSADLAAIAENLRRAQEIRNVMANASLIDNFTPSDEIMLKDAQHTLATLEGSAKQRAGLIQRCANQAGDIDDVLRQERENIEMEKRREELRDRLGPMIYGGKPPQSDTASDAVDIVTARVAAFHEIKALIGTDRIADV